ncbi:hypothetical protein EYF80_029061 [Liparis tanakae]|uniref:LRRNT domain-containing protein n=1 Tax=Liparis tanakae TaxID=230148 RepID=A0A4Z2H4C7_9TELE|nr:hypothetical protein EYF80_029061 [Liparis tanakae]
MRVFLLLCLLALGNAKPYQSINVMDFMRNYDIMMADSSHEEDEDDEDDDNNLDDKNVNVKEVDVKEVDVKEIDVKEIDEDDDDDDEDYDDNCPAGCQCSPRVVQCSDKGERSLYFDQKNSQNFIIAISVEVFENNNNAIRVLSFLLANNFN